MLTGRVCVIWGGQWEPGGGAAMPEGSWELAEGRPQERPLFRGEAGEGSFRCT